MDCNSASSTNTSNESKRIAEGKAEVNVKKEPKKEKLTVFRYNLNKQRRLLTNILKFVNDEQKEHENNICLLEKGVSVGLLYDDIFKRQKKIPDDLNKLNCNENLILFLQSVFNLQVKVKCE